MWGLTASFPSICKFGGSFVAVNNNNNNVKVQEGSKRESLSVRGASFFDYPLASRLIVTNLPYSTNETRLQQEFSNFGEIAQVLLAKDRVTKRSKGYAFIQYTSQDDAVLALENMDCKKFDGRMIYVELAKPGSNSSRGFPKTSGPSKDRPKLAPEEVADCWY